jgi:AcrR family transcriptional regulator
MLRKPASGSPRLPDRRVQRTHRLLSEALIALMVERGYEALTVQDILDRANIGRSTFYMHYRSKEELLISGIESLRRGLQEVQRRISASNRGSESALAFTEALFDHVSRHRDLYHAIVGRQSGVIVMREFQKMYATLVRRDLEPFAPRGAHGAYLLDMVVSQVSGSLMSTISAWLERHPLVSPQEINKLFLRLTLPGTMAVLRGGVRRQ